MMTSVSSPRTVAPTPLADVGIASNDHYDTTTPDELYNSTVAKMTYRSPGTAPVTVEARVGDYNHGGHLVEGSLRDAIRAAREEATVDEIDMPELGSAAVLRGPKEGAWYVAPLMGYVAGNDEEPATNLPIDPKAGSTYGPGRIWDDLGGYTRPGRVTPDGIDSENMRVRAERVNDDLVAIVGADRWIKFGTDA